MREIVLKIKSAKVINTNLSRLYGDLKTTGRNGKPVETTNDMENIIHINHIINALHVMLGARSVSFKHGDRSKLSPRICDIVKNGIIRYDNIFYCTKQTKDGSTIKLYNNEFTQGIKSAFDSSRKAVSTIATNGDIIDTYLTWNSLEKRKFFSPQYNEVIKLLNEFGVTIGCDNLKKEFSLIDLLFKIRDEYPEFIDKFLAIKEITPIIDILLKRDKVTSFCSIARPNLAGLGNIHAPTPKVSVDATVILFMEDEDAEKFLNSKRFATILDGGYIIIAVDSNNVKELPYIDSKDIDDDIDDYLIDNFIKINTLPYTKHENQN